MSRASLIALLLSVAGAPLRAQSVVYTLPGAHAGDGFGRALAAIPDVDGDGRGDFAVGASLADSTVRDCGAVTLVSGATGTRLWTAFGAASFDWLGWSVADAGDLDGDGVHDVLAGAQQTAAGATQPGYVRAFSGASGALLFELAGAAPDDEFGISVDGVPDLNGDGVPELAVGAWQADVSGVNTGRVSVHSGADRSLLLAFDGAAVDDRLGISVKHVGDTNGDGQPDLAIGVLGSDVTGANAGSVLVYALPSGQLVRAFHGAGADDHFGFAVAPAGDVDGDGLRDVLVGARYAEAGAGVVVGSVRILSPAHGALLREVFGTVQDGLFGYTVDGGRDVDQDGVPDFVVGAMYESSAGNHSGAAYVFSGGSGTALARLAGEDAEDQFGRGVTLVSDLSGDGRADAVLGAFRDDLGGQSSGSVRVVRGFDLEPAVYCSPKINSRGCTPAIAFSGSTSLTGPDDLVVRAGNVLSSQYGMFFFGRAPDALPWRGGTLCSRGPHVRTPAQLSGGSPPPSDCSGTYALALPHAWLAQLALGPGTTIYGQWYSRDPGFAPPNNVGLTDALAITVRL